jgi:phage shock protein A
MTTLLARIRGLLRAQAHRMVDRAEDPQLMAYQLLRDLGRERAAANRSLIAAMGAQRQLQSSRERMIEAAQGWDVSAEALLRKGQERLTREALERAAGLRHSAAGLEASLERAERAVERLRIRGERLRCEFERVRQRVAAMDVNRAESRALHGAAEADDAYSRAVLRAQELDRYERKSQLAVCEEEAVGEVLDREDQLERDVAHIDMDAAVDMALEALRRRIASQPMTPSATPFGAAGVLIMEGFR